MLRDQGFDNIVITVGAQLGKTLSLDGADCDGVIDALQFLRAVETKPNPSISANASASSAPAIRPWTARASPGGWASARSR